MDWNRESVTAVSRRELCDYKGENYVSTRVSQLVNSAAGEWSSLISLIDSGKFKALSLAQVRRAEGIWDIWEEMQLDKALELVTILVFFIPFSKHYPSYERPFIIITTLNPTSLEQIHLPQWFSKCGPWTDDNSITWKLVKHENAEPSPDAWIRTVGWGPAIYVWKALQLILMRTKGAHTGLLYILT